MTHKPAKLITALILGASLSGCSTLSNFGHSFWSGTQKVTNSAAHSVAQFFRGTPRTETGKAYVYGGSDATLNTHLLAQRVASQHSTSQPVMFSHAQRRISPQPSAYTQAAAYHVPQPQGVPKLRGRYKSYQSYEVAALQSSRPASQAAKHPAQPVKQASAEQTGALSYVKIGGGSRMSDWQSCETQSGGYFHIGQTGYTVEPAFDACMRGLGYITENEAEAKFAALESHSTFAP